MDRLIEGVILSYHMPLYLKVYGQAHQKSEMAAAAAAAAAATLPFYKSGARTTRAELATQSGQPGLELARERS